MAKKVSVSSPLTNSKSDSAEKTVKSQQPLVFISHDTKDADLAEEFSTLLRNSSAGALKSFRSSDKKGTQGIEYGLEWYPAIMDKIDEASDVVCLLTQNSVDRPWILYEAGVAKGKLNMKVIGIALGIPLTEAVKGPFAQFQNNDGDVDSITKLVYDLVKKVPGLDPDRDVVKSLVSSFLDKVSKIIDKKVEAKTEKETTDDNNDNSVVKLFEEVKIMFQDLPYKIENRNEWEHKRFRGHPKHLVSLLHMEPEEDWLNSFLIVISLLKDDFPWIYEIGFQVYNAMQDNVPDRKIKKLIDRFSQVCEMTSRHRILRETLMRGGREDLHYILEELKYFVHRSYEFSMRNSYINQGKTNIANIEKP